MYPYVQKLVHIPLIFYNIHIIIKLKKIGDTVMKTMKDLKNLKRVKFNDYSEYESDKSNNGGCYGFWTNYDKLEDGRWQISYGTTADFEFCSCCGGFGSSCGCEEHQTVTDEELLKLINGFTETEDEYLEFKTEGSENV